jgi:hypothetical protein
MPNAVYLVVRTVVADRAHRQDFDHWYATEHFPEALAGFGAINGFRAWSPTDPAVHYAFYRFPDQETARGASGGDAIKGLIEEFDRCWGSKTSRTRELIELAQEAG